MHDRITCMGTFSISSYTCIGHSTSRNILNQIFGSKFTAEEGSATNGATSSILEGVTNYHQTFKCLNHHNQSLCKLFSTGVNLLLRTYGVLLFKKNVACSCSFCITVQGSEGQKF